MACEDPDGLLFTLSDRSDLIRLKLRRLESSQLLIIEATAAVAGFFQPAIDGIPTDAFDVGDS